MASSRYLKITNLEVPGGNFAISSFRVFGKGDGKTPEKIENFEVKRNPNNKRSVNLTWNKPENVTGYNISFGVDKNRLYQNYMVYQDTTLTINILNSTLSYYFSIESFNENGITSNDKIVSIE
jgi:xylan 1,4-beta-xylosidase